MDDVFLYCYKFNIIPYIIGLLGEHLGERFTDGENISYRKMLCIFFYGNKIFHPSRPHNKLIADVFYKAGFIESWGRGTQRIIDKCIAEGLSAPVYEYKMGFLYLIFSNERVNERVNGLSETERKVYDLLEDKPYMKQKELSKELDLTEQYIRKIIKSLKDKRIIERVGSDKSGYWKVKVEE